MASRFYFGRQTHTFPALSQPHKNIELLSADGRRISAHLVEFYQKGMSLSDIAEQTGRAQSSVRDILIRAGVQLRPKSAVPVAAALKESGKRNVLPYFGFCYFQGQVVPDQREYAHLVTIYSLWKRSMNPNAISDHLNSKKIPPRKASAWNRNSVVNILKRFESGVISLKRGQLELAVIQPKTKEARNDRQ